MVSAGETWYTCSYAELELAREVVSWGRVTNICVEDRQDNV